MMRKGRQVANDLVVSLFVNPTQFGPNEDFAAYPQKTERDLAMAEAVGVDAVFMPATGEMYPEGFQTYVDQSELPDHLCGLSRPGHFRGVLTVVAKLFNIIRPHIAVFGRKDYQQIAIVRQMVRDLNFDIEIESVPTVREADGLAMSSRNSRLEDGQREAALSLHQALQMAQELVLRGERRSERLIESAGAVIQKYPDASIDYIKICDAQTLNDAPVVDRPTLMALAVKVGEVRLIDHAILEPRD